MAYMPQADIFEQMTVEAAETGYSITLGRKVNVRDCAFIAKALAKGEGDTLPSNADYSGDGKINVRDAAAIASALAKGEIK